MARTVSPATVSSMLKDGRELAFLDVREVMPFGTGHPLLSANTPLSRLELTVGARVPRLDTRVVLADGGEGLAETALSRMAAMGYTDLSVLEGGAPAWAAAGYTLFPEIEVPTKGFGAFAEHYGRPAYIAPRDFDAARKSGEDWIVVDSRPRWEFQNGCIPGGIDAPGADLLRCFEDLVPDPSTKVLVNCMSFTRGTLGGLSLMAAEVPNEVYVLRHGTRGWLLDGFELEVEAERFLPPPSAAALAAAQERARRIADRAGLVRIDAETLARWQADASRTTYVIDVRSAAEFAAGHLAGTRNAPEGAVVMSPDKFFATLNARIVLADDDGVRAIVTALWLAQMGWGEVAVLQDGIADLTLVTGPEPPPVSATHGATAVGVAQLEEMRAAQALPVIDIGASDAYIEGHVPGAVWCPRTGLGRLIETEMPDRPIVLTSEDGVLAAIAIGDLSPALRKNVSVLDGGNAAWRDAGFALAAGAEVLAGPRDDHWLASSERPGDVTQNVYDYLNWELGLLGEIERSGHMPYRNLIWT